MMILAYLYLLIYCLFLYLFVFKKNKGNNNGCEENESNGSEGKNKKKKGGERKKKKDEKISPLTVVNEVGESKKKDGGEGSQKKKKEPLTVVDEGARKKQDGGEGLEKKKKEPFTVVDEGASKKKDGGEGSEKKRKKPLTVIDEGASKKKDGGEGSEKKKKEPVTVIDENASKNKHGSEKKKKDEKGPVTVIMKVDMHCEGCASEIASYVRKFEGVETVKTEVASNKITVVGALDPIEIRDKLRQKTGKQVDLVSHQVDKDKENSPEPHNRTNAKKRNEPLVTTVVLKMTLHCDGCTKKIRKAVTRFKGVTDVSVDKRNELVTIKGSMDDKALTEYLKQKFNRPVEMVTPKKDQEEGKEPNNSDGGDKPEAIVGHGDEGGDSNEDVRDTTDIEIIDQRGFTYPYGYHARFERRYPVKQFYVPQMSCHEKPNACSILQLPVLV